MELVKSLRPLSNPTAHRTHMQLQHSGRDGGCVFWMTATQVESQWFTSYLQTNPSGRTHASGNRNAKRPRTARHRRSLARKRRNVGPRVSKLRLSRSRRPTKRPGRLGAGEYKAEASAWFQDIWNGRHTLTLACCGAATSQPSATPSRINSPVLCWFCLARNATWYFEARNTFWSIESLGPVQGVTGQLRFITGLFLRQNSKDPGAHRTCHQ